MPAQPWVTGPAHIFWSNPDESPRYVGTAEKSPQWTTRYGFVPLMNDLSGPVVPLDMLAVQKDCYVYADLTRWDYDVVQEMQTMGGENTTEGTWDGDVVGTLMIHEENFGQLFIAWPYSDKEQYADMPSGLHFYASWLVGPDNWALMGTNPKKIHLSWYCLPKRQTDGRFQLFEYDLGAATGVATP